VRLLLAIVQSNFPVVPDVDVATIPYVAPDVGMLSVNSVLLFENVDDAVPLFVIVIIQLNELPTSTVPLVAEFVFVTVKSGSEGAMTVNDGMESGRLALFEESFTTIVQFVCVPRESVWSCRVLFPTFAVVFDAEQSPP
jgi:hypothetical protein